MTTNFFLSSRTLSRTFKERLADLHQTSILGGIINLFAGIITIVIALTFGILWSLILRLLGKEEKKKIQPTAKEINTQEIRVKPFNIYEKDAYYEYLKTKFNYTDDDFRDFGEFCFIETIPEIKEFDKKIFTYHMTDFSNGLILQEVDFDKWTSNLIFFDPIKNKTEKLEELKYIYDLSFEKISENELNIYMRFPGEKRVLTIRRN